jgi:hypothetical protein
MKHEAPHEISGPKSAHPHGGIPSPGAYGRMPHNASFGFLDLTPATLGQIYF